MIVFDILVFLFLIAAPVLLIAMVIIDVIDLVKAIPNGSAWSIISPILSLVIIVVTITVFIIFAQKKHLFEKYKEIYSKYIPYIKRAWDKTKQFFIALGRKTKNLFIALGKKLKEFLRNTKTKVSDWAISEKSARFTKKENSFLAKNNAMGYEFFTGKDGTRIAVGRGTLYFRTQNYKIGRLVFARQIVHIKTNREASEQTITLSLFDNGISETLSGAISPNSPFYEESKVFVTAVNDLIDRALSLTIVP